MYQNMLMQLLAQRQMPFGQNQPYGGLGNNIGGSLPMPFEGGGYPMPFMPPGYGGKQKQQMGLGGPMPFEGGYNPGLGPMPGFGGKEIGGGIQPFPFAGNPKRPMSAGPIRQPRNAMLDRFGLVKQY